MANEDISKQITAKFGNHLRSRVNGILIQDDKLLMIRHKMGNQRVFWSVPGGGMEYGAAAEENLKREFIEETGLEVAVEKYLFVHELLAPPLHAMEHFFLVRQTGGKLMLGKDPELSDRSQIIEEISWMDLKSIQSLPHDTLHQIFWGIKSLEDLVLLRGYFKFGNNYLK
ncbi:NUDIX hydrolase [Algoriphagus halophytocola]|uniref:NUDIX hydrolase n=1 Tax=Algoriphagus halophytocola TaxID=2991499 RepID=A0ABY6MGB7_9BACT|nr:MULTISPECIES: NUDIX hydrolase [unclassified Algoriphagus]UZD22832.1 NUDIX hydrolase [Algoriphagus sp. TR-M5]WBL44099.1 NUDIX hydrolase [Algoriphagus sp. TR-M9]